MNRQFEYYSQCAVLEWALMSEKKYPCLKWLHSSLNGVKLSLFQAKKVKRAGMKKGIFDLFLPKKNSENNGLYIEMKHGRNKPTKEQIEFKNYAEREGFKCAICYDAKSAINEISEYLENI